MIVENTVDTLDEALLDDFLAMDEEDEEMEDGMDEESETDDEDEE